MEAPLIARAAKPGQFVVVRIDEKGERIPLTIADSDSKNMISLVFQEVGASTRILGRCEMGDGILDVFGPLGHPTEIENFGTVVCVGGGVGIAVIHPVSQSDERKRNKVITIIGSRCEDALIFPRRTKRKAIEFFITTDDGTCGRKGFVSDELKHLIESGHKDRQGRRGRARPDDESSLERHETP